MSLLHNVDTEPTPLTPAQRQALRDCHREWRWWPVAALAAATLGMVASHLWPLGFAA